MCLYPFARTNVFSAKNMCFAIWARDGARWHTILEFVPSCPICGWLAWWCDFFPVGPTFENHPQVFGQKKVQPLAPRPLRVTFLVGEAEHMCLYPFARQMCLQLYKLWTSRSFEFSGLNGSVFTFDLCTCILPFESALFEALSLHFAFRERPLVTSNMLLEINILMSDL